jgi:pyrroloquinoline-quinone synthase
MFNATDIAARLDRATQDRRLLDHDFYKAWTQGALTVDDLHTYSKQYFRQVEAFPTYLRTLADKLDGDARNIVLDNLNDEVADDHAGLWLQFAAAVGADAAEVTGSVPEPETTRCVKSFSDGIDTNSAAFGLGMIYGYESQTPAVAKTKIEGLRGHYEIDGDGVTYFELHGELDVEHTAELTKALEQVCTDEASIAEAEAGAAAGANAIWGLLDGVARVRNITC